MPQTASPLTSFAPVSSREKPVSRKLSHWHSIHKMADSSMFPVFVRERGAIKPQHFTQYPKWSIHMMVCAWNNFTATRSPNSFSHPLPLGKETGTSEKRTRMAGCVTRPKEPSLPRTPAQPQPAGAFRAAWSRISTSRAGDHVHRQGSRWGPGNSRKPGCFREALGTGVALWQELSEVREALLSLGSGGPERDAHARRPLLLVVEQPHGRLS